MLNLIHMVIHVLTHSVLKKELCLRMLTTCVYLQYMLYVQYRVTTVEVRLTKLRINDQAQIGGFVSEHVLSLIKVKVTQTMHMFVFKLKLYLCLSASAQYLLVIRLI